MLFSGPAMAGLALCFGGPHYHAAAVEDPVQPNTCEVAAEVHSPPGAAPWRASEDCLEMILPSGATTGDKRDFLISKGFLVDYALYWVLLLYWWLPRPIGM